MKEVSKKERITRRRIFQLSSAGLATAGVFAGVNTAKDAQDSGKKSDSAKPDTTLTTGKIALEEHFAPPDIVEPYAQRFSPELWRQISQRRVRLGFRRSQTAR